MTTYTFKAGRPAASSSAVALSGTPLTTAVTAKYYTNGAGETETAKAIVVDALLNKSGNALTGNNLAKAVSGIMHFQAKVAGNVSASLKVGVDTYEYKAVKVLTTDSGSPTAPVAKVEWNIAATTADAYVGLSFLKTQDLKVTTADTIGEKTRFDGSILTGKVTFDGALETSSAMEIITGAGADTITGGGGNDTISGLAGNDSILGGAGADSILGGDGDDAITGGAGADTIDGGAGNDTYTAGEGTAISVTLNTSTAATVTITGGSNDSIKNIENVTGTTGDDSVTGDSAANVLSGLAGNDTLSGGAGADSISGGDNADSLVGGSGDDTLIGGTGTDTMAGGVGIDTFLFAAGDTGTPSATAFDTIVDYSIGTDVIDFGSTSISQFTASNTTAAAGTAGVSSAGVVSFDSGDATLAARLAAVQAAMAANTTAGKALIFGVNSDAYVYISDSVAGAGANDVLIKLAGVTVDNSTDTLILGGGDIVALG